MTINERIDAGEFRNPMPYPQKPLRGSVGKDVDKPDAGYEVAKKEWLAQLKKHAVAELEAHDGLKLALCKEHAMPPDHPFAVKSWEKAWEDGHVAGLKQVVNEFLDMVALWKIAVDKGMKV